MAADSTAQALRLAGPSGQVAGTATVELAVAEQARSLVHELRNKLVPLKGAMDIVSESLPIASRSARVSKAMEVAGRVIEDLFRYIDVTVELTSGLRPPPRWFGLAQALRDAWSNGRNGNIDAEVVLDGHPESLEIYGPDSVFVEAIGNLVRNAVQIVRNISPRVRVTVTLHSEDFWLDVDDNGPGVPKESRKRIFDSGVSMRDGGTGQGLFLVRQSMAREFDATITCLDTPGGGARFRVTLPALRIRRIPGRSNPGDEQP